MRADGIGVVFNRTAGRADRRVPDRAGNRHNEVLAGRKLAVKGTVSVLPVFRGRLMRHAGRRGNQHAGNVEVHQVGHTVHQHRVNHTRAIGGNILKCNGIFDSAARLYVVPVRAVRKLVAVIVQLDGFLLQPHAGTL